MKRDLMSTAMRRAVVVLVVLVLGGAGPAEAQSLRDLDRRVLRGIYGVEVPVFTGTMQAADASFYPVALGAPVVAWGIPGGRELAGHDADFGMAYRLTVSEAGATAIVLGIKYLVRRPRPYETVAGITSRSPRMQPGEAFDPHAFPSGHAAVSFAFATSLTLSHPRWYVAGPTYAWAASVAASRVWLGVHYPSDVLVGAVVGAAVGLTVHQIRDAITPGGQAEESTSPAGKRLFVLRWSLGQ
jgi:membrane-associated phospholipid phosphatase